MSNNKEFINVWKVYCDYSLIKIVKEKKRYINNFFSSILEVIDKNFLRYEFK